MPEGFEYWQSDSDGQWYFHLKSPNNEIIAQSEGYTTMQNCLNGIEVVKQFAPNAPVTQK
ncbi:hypothetical protein MBGDF03_00158 [Thermoplasmatales archaeon SCGC AB-540-F20]|nr:hypothetical protein MBGDF03_00158 [Thermoplasmatales archaeon SCGC AB-540-F20]